MNLSAHFHLYHVVGFLSNSPGTSGFESTGLTCFCHQIMLAPTFRTPTKKKYFKLHATNYALWVQTLNEDSPYSSYNLDHLGLIAGMVDEWGLPELIDTVIKQDHEQRQVSVGQCVKSMILNGLGFVNRALYLMPHFFNDKPVERLLGAGVAAAHLNDDALGMVLDTIHAYDPEALYGQLADQSVKRLWLSCKVGHIDTSSFHVDGVYNSGQEEVPEGIIHSTQGYSRDHRPDLNQVILQLLCEHQAGIPLGMDALSGNSSDKASFRQTLNAHLEQWRGAVLVSR
jgi:transposase